MKKQYFIPLVEEVRMESVGVLMGSPVMPPDPISPRRPGDIFG